MKLSKGNVSVRLKGHVLKEVAGYDFTYEGLSFNVHKDVNSPSNWKVTEPRTGLSVTWSTTRKGALERFENVFQSRGKEAFESVIAKNIEMLESYK